MLAIHLSNVRLIFCGVTVSPTQILDVFIYKAHDM
jgi:hypothetical protein